jgi:hypothetical protein
MHKKDYFSNLRKKCNHEYEINVRENSYLLSSSNGNFRVTCCNYLSTVVKLDYMIEMATLSFGSGNKSILKLNVRPLNISSVSP